MKNFYSDRKIVLFLFAWKLSELTWSNDIGFLYLKQVDQVGWSTINLNDRMSDIFAWHDTNIRRQMLLTKAIVVLFRLSEILPLVSMPLESRKNGENPFTIRQRMLVNYPTENVINNSPQITLSLSPSLRHTVHFSLDIFAHYSRKTAAWKLTQFWCI